MVTGLPQQQKLTFVNQLISPQSIYKQNLNFLSVKINSEGITNWSYCYGNSSSLVTNRRNNCLIIEVSIHKMQTLSINKQLRYLK